MKKVVVLLALAWAAPALSSEQEAQKALIQRDQQSAESAAGVNRGALEALHQRQLLESDKPLHAAPEIARQLRPYERERMSREREAHVLQLPPPRVVAPPTDHPRPLPRISETATPLVQADGGAVQKD